MRLIFVTMVRAPRMPAVRKRHAVLDRLSSAAALRLAPAAALSGWRACWRSCLQGNTRFINAWLESTKFPPEDVFLDQQGLLYAKLSAKRGMWNTFSPVMWCVAAAALAVRAAQAQGWPWARQRPQHHQQGRRAGAREGARLLAQHVALSNRPPLQFVSLAARPAPRLDACHPATNAITEGPRRASATACRVGGTLARLRNGELMAAFKRGARAWKLTVPEQGWQSWQQVRGLCAAGALHAAWRGAAAHAAARQRALGGGLSGAAAARQRRWPRLARSTTATAALRSTRPAALLPLSARGNVSACLAPAGRRHGGPRRQGALVLPVGQPRRLP